MSKILTMFLFPSPHFINRASLLYFRDSAHTIQGAVIPKSSMITEQCDKNNILHSFLQSPHMPTVHSHMGEQKYFLKTKIIFSS